MKLETTTKLTVAAICLWFAGIILTSVVSSHGQGQSQNASAGSGPGFNRDNNPGVVGGTAADGARFDSQNNPGTMGSAFGQSNAAGASANGNGGSANGSSETGLLHRNEKAGQKSRGHSAEEMIVTHVEGKGIEHTVKENSEQGSSQKAEHDTTFDGSIMNAGISPIPKVSPIPSASPAARPSAIPRVSPIPSASPRGRPAETPRVAPNARPPSIGSPIPNALESRGIDPVPSVTVSLGD